MSFTLLLWGLECSVQPAAFGARRCIVELTFTDQPDSKQHWWFLNEDGRSPPYWI